MSGPYDFLLDTGMQITMVDPSLAAELHLQPHGAAVVAGAGSRQSASYVQLDLLEAGSHAVSNSRVFVYDLQKLHIQGILGEDFLEHFDMLIDNVHGLLCLDDSGAMRAEVKGPHIPLVASAEPEQGSPLPDLPIISVRLSDAMRPVRLMLDSGANGAILYNTSEYLAPPRTRSFRGDRRGRKATDIFGPATARRENRLTQIERSDLRQPPGTQKDRPRQGVRRHPDAGALPARLHRPRRSFRHS